MIQYLLLFNRQGNIRLQKWFIAFPEKQRGRITRELISQILSRKSQSSLFLDYKDLKIVYKRYASLYFVVAIEQDDNSLLTLEVIHRYVEILDQYFGSVCELDIIFNFEKAYFILDEILSGGEVLEINKNLVLELVKGQDELQEEDMPLNMFEEFGPTTY